MSHAILAAAAAFAAALAATMPAHAAGERMGAEVTCTQQARTLVYDCLLVLKGRDSGRPIQGAAVVIGADMPSMPMAHNIKPVKAEPTGKAGEYRFRLQLDMHGEWALKIRLAKPRQDLIVHRMTFGRPAN